MPSYRIKLFGPTEDGKRRPKLVDWSKEA